MKNNLSLISISLFISLLLIPQECHSKKNSLITLDEENWDQMLTGEWMVEFFAPWCPACRSMQADWKSFADWSQDLSIKVGAVDVTLNPGLSGRFMVTALPTIYHVKDGVFRQYKGSRDSNTFVSFVEEKKWQSIEPVPSWKAPNSYQMSIVSYFFKISMALRAIHNRLVDDYGIPYWGSYILFAFATILLGAILGLLIVCVIDLIFPAKMTDEFRDRKKSDDIRDNSSDIVDDRNQPQEEDNNSSDDSNQDSNGLRRRRKKSEESEDKEN